ncbi:ubiquitin-binding protein cue5 [Trapelia coarctata]|nr:ubiquitin-binding protein cue5 [Trapelia coarctata]
MSDPGSQQEQVESAPPPQPPRPTPSPRLQSGLSQLEADEQYARQLAEHYNGAAAYGAPPPRSSSREQRGAPRGVKPQKEMGLKPNELYDDREHSFLDDDLPVIRENIRKGFFETQSKFNSFITGLKKKIDGEVEEDPPRQPSRTGTGFGPGTSQQQYGGRRSGDMGRRSGDHSRYDADPKVLGDDFATLQMRDDTAPPRHSTRPLANPDLFKPTPLAPQSGSDRRVSFQEGPPEEIGDLHRGSPDPIKRPTSSTSRGKWQPLAAVEPSPVADHDPFSLGDSDDEVERRKDGKAEGVEGVKGTAADTAPSATVATENKEAEKTT